MKKILVLASLLTVGCAVPETINESCGGDLRVACNSIFGELNDHEQQLRKLNQQQVEAELEREAILVFLATLNNSLIQQADALQTLSAESETNFLILQQQTNTLQQQINNNIVQIAALQNEPVIELIDPCGDGPGYDEILLRTKSNKLIAYFEQGTKRFLTELVPGNYATTDNTGCTFMVTSNGEVL